MCHLVKSTSPPTLPGPGSCSKCFQHLTRVHSLTGLSERVTFRRSRVSATWSLAVRLREISSAFIHSPTSPVTGHSLSLALSEVGNAKMNKTCSETSQSRVRRDSCHKTVAGYSGVRAGGEVDKLQQEAGRRPCCLHEQLGWTPADKARK